MEPLILNPIYKEKVWGDSELLKQFYNITKKQNIGEYWNFTFNNDYISRFKNCNYDIKDMLLNKNICKKFFGDEFSTNNPFPFLIKTLFINDIISLQVHPNDKFAKMYENSLGKDEVWYVLYADENSYANIGLKYNINKKQIRKLVEENKIMNYLNKVKIKTGDIINIPAGTLHSVSGKAIIYEVQQNSNITYRLYDYHNRKLEIEKALKVLKNKSVIVKNKKSGRLIKTRNFTIDRVNIYGRKEIKVNGKFEIITVIEGDGTLVYSKSIKIHKGMTLLIPVDLKRYIILGNISILITY